jgi:hypothetical protein
MVLRTVLDALGEPEALEKRLAKAARRCCDLLTLAAVVIRDRDNHVTASSGPAEIMRPAPSRILEERTPPTLTPAELWAALLAEGARIPLMAGGHRLGWLDFWGAATPAHRRVSDR